MTRVCASTYGLAEAGRRLPARELWMEIASDLAAQFQGRYAYRDTWKYRIANAECGELSPDRALVRYRTIETGIRRQPGKPTLLDLSVGNLFTSTASRQIEPVHVVNDRRYATWARRVGCIPLSEHIRLIEQFVEDVLDAGWMLEKPELKSFQVRPPLVRNGRGEFALPLKGFGHLARQPAVDVPQGTRFVIVSAEAMMARRASDLLEQAFQRSFPGSLVKGAAVACSTRMVPEATNLVMLEDRADLGELHDLRSVLREAEDNGLRFKLAKTGSLSKPYPTQNIAYDLFQIAGGQPWLPASPQSAFCSIDAGHNAELQKSRWVKVESDAWLRIHDVRAILTPLAEHVPATCIDDLWPLQDGAIVCRDGRLSQERESLQARARSEQRPMIEAKKSPRAIIWRSNGPDVHPAEFGDALLDEHGDVLLQTVPQDIQDYIHPIRLSVSVSEVEEMATAFLHQHAVPGLSLFHMSRLPGTLYFADLISKLTSDGWPKAIGRGFRLASLVP